MPTLTVKDFSCIRSATFELRPITVLIGPQASGKSLLTKLFFFFANILTSQFDEAQEGHTAKAFQKGLAKEFAEWFPPMAWGKRRFEITYEAGPFKCQARRRANPRRMYDEVEIEVSDFFLSQYADLLKEYRALARGRKAEDDGSHLTYDHVWRIRSNGFRTLREALGDQFIQTQLFTPAGRSFFTNLGKAFAMLEYGSQLDELTKRFGRLFTSLIDGDTYFFPDKPNSRFREFLRHQKEEISKIFGGEIKLSRNDRHISTSDGRRIPLSILSSGQQELLPLVLIIQYFTNLYAYNRERFGGLLYIEEPEAHLFPGAQAALTSHMAEVSNLTSPAGRMLMTTHSPYVLAELNNLLKAYAVAHEYGVFATRAVQRIIPQQSWLGPTHVEAYALQNGILSSIRDDTGLLNAEYLDSISSDISSSFMSLLEVESRYGRSSMRRGDARNADQGGGKRQVRSHPKQEQGKAPKDSG